MANSSSATSPVSETQARKPKSIPFWWILPWGQFVFCWILLAPSLPAIASQFGIHVPDWAAFYLQFTPAVSHNIDIVIGLDLPAGIIDVLFWPKAGDGRVWTPGGVDLRIWEALTWPVLGMVFWWSTGRAIEALVAYQRRQITPKISWVEAIVGFLLTAGGVSAVVGFLFFTSSEDRWELWNLWWIVAAAGLWALLGSLSVMARIAQRRLRKQLAALPEAPS